MQVAITTINDALQRDAAAYVQLVEQQYDEQLDRVVADVVATHRQRPVILVSGPSGSGKTTTAHILEKKLRDRGLATHTLSMDNYFRPLSAEQLVMVENGTLDLESPDRVDAPYLSAQLADIIAGRPVELPLFNFATHGRDMSGEILIRGEHELVIVEGIHALNPDAITLPSEQTTRLYVSVRTRLEERDGDLLHPEKIRLMRRLLRDKAYRHRPFAHTLRMYESVQAGEQKYVMPYKGRATHDIDTFFAYEASVYKPLLYDELCAIDAPQITDLKKALAEIQGVPTRIVPSHALIREFIGGSVFYEDNVIEE